LISRYQSIDVTIVREIVEHRLDDLLRFADAIRRRL
jgi:uncharacterized protein YutE (UPF0331/DUF86 family)